jgi:hypothetical protein
MNNHLANSLEKKVVRAAFWVLFGNTVIESFLLYFEDRFTIILFQLFLNFGFFLFLFFKKFKVRFSKDFLAPVLLIMLFLVMSLFSSDLLLSMNMLLKFSIPFAFLFIGYSLRTYYFSYFIVNYVWVFLAYFVFYFLIVNYFGIGYEMYIGGVKTGYYSLNGLYVPVFCLILISFFYQKISNRKVKVITFIFALLSIAILLAILKRTLLVILFLGLIALILYNFNLRFLSKLGFTLLFSGIIFFMYFYSDFQKTFESRESRFNTEYNILNEGRITENFHIYSLMKDNAWELIFGTGEVFNDRKYIAYTFYEEDREVHSSYARIFWNGGFLGLALFLYFYWIQIKVLYVSFKLFRNKLNPFKLLFYFGLVFVLLRFISDFSSGITYLGYNAFSYFLLGFLFSLNSNFKRSLRIKVGSDFSDEKRIEGIGRVYS